MTAQAVREEATGAREQAMKAVLRIKPEEMDGDELDMAAGLLMQLPVVIVDGKASCEYREPWGVVVRFSPSKDWSHYGHLISNAEFVVGSHAMYDDQEDPERVTGHWYSAHSFFGNTKTEGFELRSVVLITAAKRLEHDAKYPKG